MEEKVLVKSIKHHGKINHKKMLISITIVIVFLSITSIIGLYAEYIESYDMNQYHTHNSTCYGYPFSRLDYFEDEKSGGVKEYKMDCAQAVLNRYDGPFDYATSIYFSSTFWIHLIFLIVNYSLIYLYLFWLNSYELTVTNKRIFGKTTWGKRVDLPIDSISSTEARGLYGVSFSTSSGKISFRYIANADLIYRAVSQLLIERQQSKDNVAFATTPMSDEADQLKKYKDLLDSGVITQEEFDAKKKQLLGL